MSLALGLALAVVLGIGVVANEVHQRGRRDVLSDVGYFLIAVGVILLLIVAVFFVDRLVRSL